MYVQFVMSQNYLIIMVSQKAYLSSRVKSLNYLGKMLIDMHMPPFIQDTVKYYMLTGDANGAAAHQFFDISPNEGIVRVIQNLALAPQDLYTVSLSGRILIS